MTALHRAWAGGLALALGLAAGCGPPPAPARLAASEPPSPRELQARTRYRDRRCSPDWNHLFPGIGHLCTGQTEEGVGLIAAATADIGGAVASAAAGADPLVPLIALQDVYLYGVVETKLDSQRADLLRFVPQDTLGELLISPFNGNVMGKPEVLGGLALMTAAGLGVGFALLDRGETYHPEATPKLFGASLKPAAAYPLAGLSYAATFEHVAIAEEVAFRGWVQSTLARECGETCGMVLGAYVFGGAHAFNAIFLPPDQRARYLGIGIPLLTLDGMILGAVYRKSRYSLAPTVATHFWYNMSVSMIGYALDPRKSLISGRVALPF